MPKILIREEDKTLGLIPDIEETVIYIPGTEDITESLELNKPTLITSLDQFKFKYSTKEGEEDVLPTTKSAIMAYELVAAGAIVLYEKITAKAELELATHWAKLADKGHYNIKFLTCGGFEQTANMVKEMINLAAKRTDCLALVDHKETITPSTGKSYVETVIDEINLLLGSATDNLKYAAAYTPWCNFNTSYVTVESNETESLPGSFAYLMAYLTSSKTNPSWYAVAGAARGGITGLSSASHDYNDSEVEILQGQSTGL